MTEVKVAPGLISIPLWSAVLCSPVSGLIGEALALLVGWPHLPDPSCARRSSMGGGGTPLKAPTRLNSMRQSHTHSTPIVFLRKVPFPLYEKTLANDQNTPFLRQLNISLRYYYLIASLDNIYFLECLST